MYLPAHGCHIPHNFGPKKKPIPISCHQFFFFLRDNYNMLLTPQLEPFPPKSPSTLYMGRCQFSYKAFGLFSVVLILQVYLSLIQVPSCHVSHVWSTTITPCKSRMKLIYNSIGLLIFNFILVQIYIVPNIIEFMII